MRQGRGKDVRGGSWMGFGSRTWVESAHAADQYVAAMHARVRNSSRNQAACRQGDSGEYHVERCVVTSGVKVNGGEIGKICDEKANLRSV